MMTRTYRNAAQAVRKNRRKLVGAALVAALSAPHAMAVDTYWTGSSSGAWNVSLNWDNGVPNSTLNAFLPAPTVANSLITLPTGAVANRLTVNGVYKLLVGDLTLADNFYADSNSAKLTMDSGGTLTTPNATVGISVGAQSNQMVVNGTGSGFSVTNRLNVGWDGQQNNLTVQGGGTVTTGTTVVGVLSTSTNNSATITGAGSTFSANTQLLVGDAGTNNAFSLLGGATANILRAILGNIVDANGNSLTVSGAGSAVSMPDSATAGLIVGNNGSNNSMTVAAGGTFTMLGSTRDAQIGAVAGANGNSLTVTGAGSQFTNAAATYVGDGGSNNLLDIQNGGKINSNNVRIGGATGSSGNIATVTGTGSEWVVNNTMRVGSSGTANQLNITAGGKVSMLNNDLFVGYKAGSADNVVTISGAGSELAMGAGTNVVIEFENGLVGTPSTTGNKVVVKDGGLLNGSSVKLGPYATLQFGAGGAPGSIKSGSTVDAPSGGGTVRFDHTSAGFTYADALTGSLRLQQAGTGTTILTGAKTYTGATEVSAGELRVNGSTSSSSAVTVSAGAKLSGTGTVGGATTVSGSLAPGDSVGQLSFGSNLTLNAGSAFYWDLAANTISDTSKFDRVQVAGDLAFAGSTTSYLKFDGAGSTVSWTDPFWTSNRQWSVFNVTGNTTGQGLLGINVSNWLDSNGALFNTVLPAASFNFSLIGSNVMLNYAVPEPSTWLLTGIGAAACWATKRRLRKTGEPEKGPGAFSDR